MWIYARLVFGKSPLPTLNLSSDLCCTLCTRPCREEELETAHFTQAEAQSELIRLRESADAAKVGGRTK